MPAKKSQTLLLKRLKKQIRILQEKEAHSRTKLRSALSKVRKLGETYQIELAHKMRVMQDKLASAQASSYVKIVSNIERRLLKNIDAKTSMLKAAVNRLEKKQLKQTKRKTPKRKHKGRGATH